MSKRNKINLIVIAAMFIYSLICVSIACGEEQRPCQLLPEELLKIATQRGFEQVTDFYINRPGMLNPPYVYGYLPGDEEDSAAFWCQKTQNGKKRYFLVFMFKKRNNELCNCPDVIEWQNYPKGLSIYNKANATLDGFIYINDPKKKVPKNVKLIYNAILSEYDGVEALFYCYKGEWLVRQRD